MFSRIGQAIFDHQALLEASNFKMGLEIEMQRVDETGHLSQEPYPAAVGDEKENPWITNDFLETMSEVVTPPAGNATDAIHYLYSINTALRIALAPGELGRFRCHRSYLRTGQRFRSPRPARKRSGI